MDAMVMSPQDDSSIPVPARQAGNPARFGLWAVLSRGRFRCRGQYPVHPRRSLASRTCRKITPATGVAQRDQAIKCGEVAEWSMAVVLKTTEPETVPGVRIPLPPPDQ